RHVRRRGGARQDLQDGLRPRPLPGVRVAAREAQQQEPLGLDLVELAGEPLVDGLEDAAAASRAVELPDPLQQAEPAGEVAAGDAAAADDLQDDGAEAEHVRLPRRAAGVEALRRDVPQRPRDAGHVGVRRLVGLERAGEAEVAEPRVEGGVEHDVGRLDVAVDHHLVVLVVEVVQRRRDAGDDVVALLPVQRRRARLAEDVPVQAAVRHVVVH
ncbi:Os02g0712650, partial [Oryza sativa Japonica Group]